MYFKKVLQTESFGSFSWSFSFWRFDNFLWESKFASSYAARALQTEQSFSAWQLAEGANLVSSWRSLGAHNGSRFFSSCFWSLASSNPHLRLLSTVYGFTCLKAGIVDWNYLRLPSNLPICWPSLFARLSGLLQKSPNWVLRQTHCLSVACFCCLVSFA